MFSAKDGAPAKLVPIYYMDTLAGVNFVPTEHVDINAGLTMPRGACDHVYTFNRDEWADAQGNTLSNSDPVSFEYSMKKAFFNKINNTAPENQRNFATKDNIGAKLHPLTIEQNAIASFKSRTTLVPCTANTIGSGLFLQADYAIGGADRTFYLSELAGPLEPECN